MDSDVHVEPWVQGTTNFFPLNGRFKCALTRAKHPHETRRSAQSRARLVRSKSPGRKKEGDVIKHARRSHPNNDSCKRQEPLPPATAIQKALWKAEVAKVDFQDRTYPEGIGPLIGILQ